MEDRRNLQIWDNNGRVVTDDDTLNNIIRSVENEEDATLAAVIPAGPPPKIIQSNFPILFLTKIISFCSLLSSIFL